MLENTKPCPTCGYIAWKRLTPQKDYKSEVVMFTAEGALACAYCELKEENELLSLSLDNAAAQVDSLDYQLTAEIAKNLDGAWT